MKSEILQFLPMIASLISLATAVIVAYIGHFHSRSMENFKTKNQYFNYKLQKLFDIYENYSPYIEFFDNESKTQKEKQTAYIRKLERKYEESHKLLMKIRPLLSDRSDVESLENKSRERDLILRNQVAADILGNSPNPVDVNHYSGLLNEYVDGIYHLIQDEIKITRKILENSHLNEVK